MCTSPWFIFGLNARFSYGYSNNIPSQRKPKEYTRPASKLRLAAPPPSPPPLCWSSSYLPSILHSTIYRLFVRSFQISNEPVDRCTTRDHRLRKNHKMYRFRFDSFWARRIYYDFPPRLNSSYTDVTQDRYSRLVAASNVGYKDSLEYTAFY